MHAKINPSQDLGKQGSIITLIKKQIKPEETSGVRVNKTRTNLLLAKDLAVGHSICIRDNRELDDDNRLRNEPVIKRGMIAITSPIKKIEQTSAGILVETKTSIYLVV